MDDKHSKVLSAAKVNQLEKALVLGHADDAVNFPSLVANSEASSNKEREDYRSPAGEKIARLCNRLIKEDPAYAAKQQDALFNWGKTMARLIDAGKIRENPEHSFVRVVPALQKELPHHAAALVQGIRASGVRLDLRAQLLETALNRVKLDAWAGKLAKQPSDGSDWISKLSKPA